MACARAPDRGVGRRPGLRPGDGRVRPTVGCALRDPSGRISRARCAGVGRARLGLEGRRLQLGQRGDLAGDGLRRRLVPVRADHVLLPGGAGVHREHAVLRVRARARPQRGVHDRGDHRAVLGRRAVRRPRGHERRPACILGDPDRHADSGAPARGDGGDLSGAGRALGGTAQWASRAAAVERAHQHRPDRQRLLHLRRGRGQRGSRRRPPEPRARVPEGDPACRDPRAARLHPADAGDLDRRAVAAHKPDRRGDAGLQNPV